MLERQVIKKQRPLKMTNFYLVSADTYHVNMSIAFINTLLYFFGT